MVLPLMEQLRREARGFALTAALAVALVRCPPPAGPLSPCLNSFPRTHLSLTAARMPMEQAQCWWAFLGMMSAITCC